MTNKATEKNTNQNNTNQKNKTQNNQKSKRYLITSNQALTLNASTIIGIGVLTLPRTITKQAHQFGWIAVLLGLFVNILAVVIIYKLGERFPNRSLVGFCQTILGSPKSKWKGRVFSFPIILVYCIYWAFLTAVVARTFGEVVVTAVLTNTPIEVIVGTMLLLCLIFSFYDVEVVARVNEVLLVIIIVPVMAISLSSFQTVKLENIMPFVPSGHWMDIVMATLPSIISFAGFEVMLVFNDHLKREKKMMKAQIYGLSIPGLVYFLIVISGIMSFGYEELGEQAWPTLELVKSINVPGLILERLEAVFIAVWVAAVFTTAGNWFYCANRSLTQLFGLKKRAYLPIPLIILIYIAAMKMGRNIEELFKALDLIGYIGLFFCMGLPLLLLLVAVFRKLDERKSDQKEDRVHEAS